MKNIIIILVLFFSLISCKQKNEIKKITFIELGSVKCKPCIRMQEVIKKVERKYPNKVKTIFYDVWTKEGEPYAKKYNIDPIPTQVFLDKDGNEYYRHEGYFEFEDLEKVLLQKID